MSKISDLSSDEKFITVIACVIGVGFFLLFTRACQPIVDYASSKDGNGMGFEDPDVVHLESADYDDSFEESPHTYEAVTDDLEYLEKNREGGSVTAATAGASETMPVSSLPDTLAKVEVEEVIVVPAVIEESEVLIVADEGDSAVLSELESENAVALSRLSEVMAENEALNKANADTASSLAALEEANAAEKAKLEGRVEDLTAQVDELRDLLASSKVSEEDDETEAAIAKPEEDEAPAFVKSEADLDESRAALVIALRKMEDLRGAELAKRYEQLESNQSATSLARVKFETGKSELLAEEAEKVTGLSSSLGKEGEFLVVGFADQTGSAKSNETLSSARAREVANFLGSKIGNARVSSIYLGQTGRFGAESENRVVEIWEVKTAQ